MHMLYDIETKNFAFVCYDSQCLRFEGNAGDSIRTRNAIYTINRISTFFIVRVKANMQFKLKTREWRLSEGGVYNVIESFLIYKSFKDYFDELRKLIIESSEDGIRYIFLTNNLKVSAELLSRFYRDIWCLELFFKWIKQYFKIKKIRRFRSMWCTHSNLLRIITCCFVAIVRHNMRLECGIYGTLQILVILLTDKTHFGDLFDKWNFKNVKNLNDSSGLNLFNLNHIHF